MHVVFHICIIKLLFQGEFWVRGWLGSLWPLLHQIQVLVRRQEWVRRDNPVWCFLSTGWCTLIQHSHCEFPSFRFVFLGVENCTKADEGTYRWPPLTSRYLLQFLHPYFRCVITNRFGKKEHKFKLFISSERIGQPIVQINILFPGSFARKAPLKREVSRAFRTMFFVINV